jgi:hypothetical protein
MLKAEEKRKDKMTGEEARRKVDKKVGEQLQKPEGGNQ